ncbi:molecular chaperone TorD family protein [Marinospirillum minutulum]|uniref:molecular chaperone TorD family protein n=1 Tax=Marinospirillum minutulum TaxID=64974 RepID=UPI000418F97C|nr:molecular chaperone TorD family protein [Marinospirillum minutulum]
MVSQQPLARVNTPERALACASIYQLAAVALGHPLPEFQDALVEGRFYETFNKAWYSVTGREWPKSPVSKDFATLEAGYIAAFTHGKRGKPNINLLAGDYGSLLEGLSRSIYMLNLQAFYKNFGLKAATTDEGRNEEPDHLVTMLECMVVLHHLEAQALKRGIDPKAYRLAQRDFLQAYLVPLFETINQKLTSQTNLELDATLVRLIEDLPLWLRQQLSELETLVGLSAAKLADKVERPASLAQNLWN